MSSARLLGLDLGGGGARALLLDWESGEVVSARRPCRSHSAPGTGGLGYDLDLSTLADALAGATRDALRHAGIGGDDVVGIAATSMRLGMVVLDEGGEALLAVPNRDARAVAAGLRLGAEHGEALYERMGRWPYPIFPAARLQWLAEAHPDAFARARHLLSLSDWIAFHLCGEVATDRSQAGESLLFDLESREWAWDWIDRLDLPRAIFPDVLAPGTQLGELRPAAAAAFGLRPGTPVAVGGADSQCGLLGAGASEPGQLAIVAGTTAPVQIVTGEPVVDAQARVWSGQHVVADRWVLESNAGPVGDALDWFGGVLYPTAPSGAAALLAAAADSEPGSAGLLSSLGVQIMNAREAAMPIGNLSLTHMSASGDSNAGRHIARAVAEGVACGLRANVEQLAEVSGLPCDRWHLTGGLAQSHAFARLLAGVAERPIEVAAVHEATALGAALCAAVAAGRAPDLVSAARERVGEPAHVTPEPAHAEQNRDLYQRWCDLHASRRESDALAAGMVTPFVMRAGAAQAEEGPVGVRPRILVTSDCDEASLERLRAFADVEYASFRDAKRMLTGPKLVEALQGFEVFVTEIDLVDVNAIAALPSLRVVASCRGDAVNVDIAACTAFGIPMLRTPGRNADAVADLTLGFLLMLARKLASANEFLRQPGIEPGDMGRMGQAFSKFRGRELWKKNVGLVGLGAVGAKVAQRVRAFGARVLVADPFVEAGRAALVGAESVSLAQLLEESDFVSLHAAVTPETTGMLGADEFAAMKPGACLVNSARAALLDEDALLAALESGHLGGAALDTFATEPPGSSHPLLSLSNVIATPHVGGNTEEVAAHQGEIIADELLRLVRGEHPRTVVNPEVLEGFDWGEPRRKPSAARIALLAEGPAPAVSDLQKAGKKKRKTKPGAALAASESAVRPEPASQPQPPVAGGATALPAAQSAAMKAIASGFARAIERDDALRAFATGPHVTLHFKLEDAGCAFHFTLGDGRVTAAVGDPKASADVELRMRAEVLDGMFTGRLNPMEAAMEGRLAFTGDAAKAMTLQNLQSDLERLYRKARLEAGDPGDLQVSAPASAGAPVEAGDPRHQLVAVVDELYTAQVITATGGNVSVRIPGSDEVWITPSQLFKGDLRPEVLVRIDLEGRSLDAGARSPSSEWDMHCAILRTKAEARAVVHAHAPNATILANTGLPFLPISTEAAFFGDIPRVPFIMPGTAELANAVALAMGEGWAVLMVNHGLIVAGRSLRRAADMVEIIERSAEVILGCHAVGREPPTLPDEIVKTLRQMGDLVA